MAYELSKNEVGKIVRIDNGSVITLSKNVFSAGDIIAVFNNSDKFIALHSSVPNTYISGKRQKRTMIEFPPRVIASIMFVDTDIVVISGEVS